MTLKLNIKADSDFNHGEYKGIYQDDTDKQKKYFDEETGAHFNFKDLFSKLNNIKNQEKERTQTPIIRINKKKPKITIMKIKQRISKF